MVHSVDTCRNPPLRDDRCNECNRDIDCNLQGIRYMAKIHLKFMFQMLYFGQSPANWGRSGVEIKPKVPPWTPIHCTYTEYLFDLMRHKSNKDRDSLNHLRLNYRRSQSRV